MYQCDIFSFDISLWQCSMSSWGNWVKGIQHFSVLFLITANNSIIISTYTSLSKKMKKELWLKTSKSLEKILNMTCKTWDLWEAKSFSCSCMMVCILQKGNASTKATRFQVHVEVLWQQNLAFETPYFPLKDNLLCLSNGLFSLQDSLRPQEPDFLDRHHLSCCIIGWQISFLCQSTTFSKCQAY